MESMMGMAAPMPQGPAMGMPMDTTGGMPMESMAPGAGAPAPNPFPSTDPAVVAQILSLIGQVQMEDHNNLQMQQDSVLQMLMGAMVPSAPSPMDDSGFAEGGEQLVGADEYMM